MAADNRNFVNKFANEGGGDMLCEDKRFEELKSATAKTSSQISTSTDYIPLQDTDGNLVKINPASFEEAVRNVLGGLLANNDKGTTISGLPALSGSGAGLDFGSITPANLASVLGATHQVLTASDNIDQILAPGIWTIEEGVTPNGTLPSNVGNAIIRCTTYRSGYNELQELFETNTRKAYLRWVYSPNTVTDWLSMDSFGCATPSALASLLGVNNPITGYSGDADNIGTGFTYGHITAAFTTNNWPENYSTGQYFVSYVNASDTRFGFQLFVTQENMYFRLKWVNWNTWVKIS